MTEIAHKPEVAFWVNQITTYEKEFSKWTERGKKIVKRYKDEREGGDNSRSQFNILWSNVQTLGPALYAKNPVPNVDRRFQDDDKLGTTAAKVLERSVSYFVDEDLFSSVMKQAVQDRLLPGRGTAWVRYVPNFKDVSVEGTDDVREDGEQLSDDTDEDSAEQELYSEDVVVDYVHWDDFGHTWGRTWEEVRGVWRKVYLSRKQLKERFGDDVGKTIPLEAISENKNSDKAKKACVYEIWDKEGKKALWVHKEYPEFLDERDDPLKLHDFFPCPKPIYATIGNDNLIPVPDYIQYQDQAKELDDLTGRINALTSALKVAGVYDANASGVERLLNEGLENTLIPVANWAVFGEKGGLAGVIDFLPIKEVMEVLASLYEARERAKQDLYEITGISDIIRGATDPRETLGAQELKGKYAGLRLDAMQSDVARFSRDLVKIMAEIIAEHFSLETIQQICGVKLLSQAQKMEIQAKQQAEQPQQPEEIKELMDLPTWEEVHELIKNDTLRCFRITIETDSTIKADQDAEKAARTEFLTAAGSFIKQAAEVPAPELQPLLMEMLMFGVRGYKVGRDMESTFDVALKKIRQKSEQPPQPDPEQERAKAEMQIKGQEMQAKMQLEGQKLQGDMQVSSKELQLKERELAIKEMELALKERELMMNADLESQRLKHEGLKTRLEAKKTANPEVAMTDPDMNEEGATPLAMVMAQLAESLNQGLQQIAMMNAQGNQAVIDAVTKPKKVVRDSQGRIAGVQ